MQTCASKLAANMKTKEVRQTKTLNPIQTLSQNAILTPILTNTITLISTQLQLRPKLHPKNPTLISTKA